ncbi:MAG: M48 family metallopeptidase [Cytophagales bacterium]|nr:M48 family metallopeptidase [Cytophagales bacterium]
MKKRYLPIFLLLAPLLGRPAFAQDFGNYQPLQSSGQIPADFLQLSSEKYEQDKSSIGRQEKAFDRRAKRQFYLENSFRVRELLYSGKVLFNDPVGVYVNQVADKLLRHDPEKRRQVRIYVVKSPAVNAFATSSGMIFINLGLLAQLETESQLAFVLAHEFTHYFNKHVVNKYVENQKISQGKKVYQSLSVEEKLLTRSNYSKELETEADLHGLDLFLKSDYSTAQLKGVFDVLQYSYLPFDDVPFQKSFLETKDLKFPPGYFLDKVKEISPPEEEDEEKSTHPSIEKRRTYTLEKIAGQAGQPKQTYLVSEEGFKRARKTARYEIASLYLAGLQYEKSVYHAYLLLQEDPGNPYLEKIIAKSLYGLSHYASADALDKVHGDYEEVEGQSQQVYHLVHKLKPKELTAVALTYAWNLRQKHPADGELATLSDSLLRTLVFRHCENKLDFATQKPAEAGSATPVTLVSTDSTDAARANKYVSIDKATGNTHFIRYALVEHFGDKAFAEAFDRYWGEKEAANRKPKETRKQQRTRVRKARQVKAREARRIRKKGAALGIDKVVMVNPWFARMDQRKKTPVQHIASESAEIALSNQILENARIAKLDVELLGDYSFQGPDAEKFNDYAFLKSWMTERLRHMDGEVTVNNLDNERVQALVARYGTRYFCWSGLVDVRERKKDVATVFLYSIVAYPLLPYAVYYAATPKYNTYYYAMVFDLATGKPVFADFQFIDRKGSQDVLNSTMYNTFYQLKKKR